MKKSIKIETPSGKEISRLLKEVAKRDKENLRINNDLKRFKDELYNKEEEVMNLNGSISTLLRREQQCNQQRREAQHMYYDFQKQVAHLKLENERAWRLIGIAASSAIVLFGAIIAIILNRI